MFQASIRAAACAAVLLPGLAVAQTTIYVDASRPNDLGSGISWGTAKQFLPSALAIARATPSVTQVRVAAGSYVSLFNGPFGVSFYGRNNLSVLGGYPAGGGVSRDPDANLTRLVPNPASRHIMAVTSGTDTTLVVDGFEFFAGAAGGVTGTSGARGGALYIQANASMTLRNCRLTGNTAVERGGAIHIEDAGGLVAEDTEFRGNLSGSIGNAVDVGQNASVTLDRCMFTRNGSNALFPNVGTVRVRQGATATVTNCGFYDNEAGRTLRLHSSSVDVTNCSFIDNELSVGSALSTHDGAAPNVTNSIFWGNTVGGVANEASNLDTAADHSCVEGWTGGLGGTGTIGADPLISVRPSTNGFWLDPNSPCIDSGSNTAPSITGTDFRGLARIKGPTVDMGSDEMQTGKYTFTGTPCGDAAISAGGQPWLGEAIRVRGSQSSGIGFLQGGFFLPPMPISLQIVGAPSCEIGIIQFATLYSGGVSTNPAAPTEVVLSLPNDPIFEGLSIYFQWYYWNPVNPISSIETSKVLDARLGLDDSQ